MPQWLSSLKATRTRETEWSVRVSWTVPDHRSGRIITTRRQTFDTYRECLETFAGVILAGSGYGYDAGLVGSIDMSQSGHSIRDARAVELIREDRNGLKVVSRIIIPERRECAEGVTTE